MTPGREEVTAWREEGDSMEGGGGRGVSKGAWGQIRVYTRCEE